MIGLDKVLGVVIIIASFYFGFKMYLMSRDPRRDIDPDKEKLRKTTKN
jgi:hypothetical protein